MKRTRIALVAGLSLLATAAIGAGLFSDYPIVGGAAYCTSFVMNPLTGAATTTCNGPTVPAGPSAITGVENFAADTTLSGGRQPQTVLIPTLTMANYSRGTGLLYSTAVVTAGVAGTGEQTLGTYSLPANTLISGRVVRMKASFSGGANGNNKTYKCYIGASVVSSGTLTDNAKNGSCEITASWLTAASQTVYGNMIHDTTNITTYVAAGTDSTAAAVVIKFTGQGGTSGVDVTMNQMYVELLGQ